MPRLIVLLLFFTTITTSAYSAWIGPVEIISGSWGKGEGQFDKEEYDTDYNVPDIAAILPDQTILIHDTVNWKMMVFKDNGEFIKEVYWKQVITDDGKREMHLPEYWIMGVGRYTKDGNVIIRSRKRAKLLSPVGELLTTYDENTLELGVVEQQSINGDTYVYKIRYEDIEYSVDGYVENFVRDMNDYLYSYETFTATDPVSGSDSNASYVVRYDKCGQKIGKLNLPVSEYEPIKEEDIDTLVGPEWIVRNEYGPPVVGPEGSVYSWKRTPDTYSILKWQWVDDPIDPKSACKK